MKRIMKKNLRISFLTVLNLALFTVSSFAQYCVQTTTYSQILGGGIQLCRTPWPAAKDLIDPAYFWMAHASTVSGERGLFHVFWRHYYIQELLNTNTGSDSVCREDIPENIRRTGYLWGSAYDSGGKLRCNGTAWSYGTLLSTSINRAVNDTGMYIPNYYDVIATVLCVNFSTPIE